MKNRILNITKNQLLGVIILGSLGYMTFSIIPFLTAEVFVNPYEWIFYFDFEYYKDKPLDMIKHLITVLYTYSLSFLVVFYMVYIRKYTFPLLSSKGGMFIMMLDGNNAKILRLTTTKYKYFEYNNGIYFLPDKIPILLNDHKKLLLIYFVNNNRPINEWNITKDHMEIQLNRVFDHITHFTAKVSKPKTFWATYPRNINKAYTLTIDNNGNIEYIKDNPTSNHVFNVGKTKLRIILQKSEESIVLGSTTSNINPTLTIENISIPLQLQEQISQTVLLKKLPIYLGVRLNMLDPFATYELMSMRKHYINLVKYFVGDKKGIIIPLLMILLIIIIILIFAPQFINQLAPQPQPPSQPIQPSG